MAWNRSRRVLIPALVALLMLLPTPTMAQIGGSPPDLVPARLTGRNLDVGDEANFTVRVENRGDGTAEANFTVRFTVDGDRLGDVRVTRDVPPDEHVDVGSPAWTAEAGTHEVQVVVDAEDDVDEGPSIQDGGEDNNRLSRSWRIGPNITASGTTLHPEDPVEGDAVRIQAGIANTGDEDVDRRFSVRVTLSQDGETVFSDRIAIDGLRFGETVEIRTSPWEAAAGGYNLTVIPDPGDRIAEVNDGDRLERSITVPAAHPDLAVTHLDPVPAHPEPGTQVHLVATVTNVGTEPVETDVPVRFVVDGSVLGPDATVHPGEEPLVPGGSRQVRSEAWTPDRGEHRLNVTADPGNQAVHGEANETNNTLIQPLTVGRDVAVTRIRPDPQRPAAGERTMLNVTVTNRGTQATQPNDLEVRVPESGFETTRQVPRLPPGNATTISVEGWTPSEQDRYRVRAEAEANGTVDGVREANDVANRTVQVTEPMPDIVVTRVTTDPNGADPGDETRVVGRVRNRGSAEASGFDVTLRIDGRRIGSNATVGGPLDPLEPGETETVRSDAWNATLGNHSARVIADVHEDVEEMDETNNAGQAPVPVGPDLAARDVEVSPRPPQPGEQVDLGPVVANTGTTQTGPVEVVLRVDGTQVANETLDGLAPGQRRNLTPATWTASAGEHTVQLIVDPDDRIAEYDEDDNTRIESFAAPGRADLQVPAISYPDVIQAGDRVVFTATVENAGSAGIEGTFSVRFTLDGHVLGTTTLGALQEGSSVTVASPPWTAREGTHTLAVQVDPGAMVLERDERDNRRTDELTVRPASPAHGPNQPTLAGLTLPEAIEPGDGVVLLATVANEGGSPAHEVRLRFTVDGEILATRTVAKVPAGRSVTVASPRWNATAGEHTVRVLLSPDDDAGPGQSIVSTVTVGQPSDTVGPA